MRTKRSLVLLLGLIMVLLPLLPVSRSAAQESVVLTLTPLDVGVAETGVIEGQIACGAGGCGGVKVTITFDRSMLRVEELNVGPYLGDQVFLAESTVDNPGGIVRLAAAAMGPVPADAGSVLFSMTVYGLKPGSVAVAVQALEINGSSGEILPSSAQIGAVNVTETGKIAFFSPPQNGWEVAFVSERDGNPEIYVVTADGRTTRRLTNHEALDASPAWSPSGDHLAFATARDGNMEIYLMDENGGSLLRLTDNAAADTEPAWSPDGTQIVFVSERDGNAELYIMNADGTDPRRLSDSSSPDLSPAWSPAGDEIVFASRRGESAELFVVKTDGSALRQMSNLFGANGWYPAWAPDGSVVSFTSERDNEALLYLMDWEGQNVQQLTPESGWLTLTDWSPDGGWIGFRAGRDGNSDLFVMDRAGVDLFRLTDNPSEDYDPDWRPTQPEACFVTIDTEVPPVEIRVGPGINRGVFGQLPPYQDFRVIGQAYDETNTVWWQLDKEQIPDSQDAASLWVNSQDVIEKGDCLVVLRVDAPPVVIGQPTPPPGTWQGCGSCDTCGHPGECVISPEGACLWDPATCHHEIVTPPPPGDGCYYVSTQVYTDAEPGGGSITLLPSPNCGNGVYPSGATVYLGALRVVPASLLVGSAPVAPYRAGRWLSLRLPVAAQCVANFNC